LFLIINELLITKVVMNVKIDTKEKFHVITLPGPSLPATMTGELENCLLGFLHHEVKNVIITLKDIETLDDAAAQKLVQIQRQFYDNNASFVFCDLQETIKKSLELSGLLENLNFTPTESEAWDIVQMEEIEREFLNGDKP
jgi:anti-anti-sigma factor